MKSEDITLRELFEQSALTAKMDQRARAGCANESAA